MSDGKLEFIIIHETVFQSWCRDASTFALFVGLIGIGYMLDSSAMQWAGFFVAIIATFVRAGVKAKKLTIEQARARLDELEDQI